MDLNPSSFLNGYTTLLQRPVGRLGLAVLTLAIVTAPAVLVFDPADIWLGRGHIARDPRSYYRLFSDDVAYASSSRTWERTVSNLFAPHNTHIVPSWRIVTWALVYCAGSMERLPVVLAVASYSILVAVMLMIGRQVARQTRQVMSGMAALVLVGTTSLMLTPISWYSAGQPLWAGLGILTTLWYAQSYRRSGRWLALFLSALSAPIAGWFWTVGHMAGPSAAVYLWFDGRRGCKFAAVVPFAATVLAVVLSLFLAARRIDATTSFHGHTVREAIDPVQGFFHTTQAIPENLVFRNLGLSVFTTQSQGVLLTLGLFALWSGRWWRRRFRSRNHVDRSAEHGSGFLPNLGIHPLEFAGAAIIIGGYLVEWSFRGYLEFKFLRTINARFLVPWYDSIPQIGAALLAAGWWSSAHGGEPPSRLMTRPTPLTWKGGLGVCLLSVLLIVLNRPRVDDLTRASAAPLLRSEIPQFPSKRLLLIRANALQANEVVWQRSFLRRVDRAEAVAKRMGWNHAAIRAAVGHPWVPGTIGLLVPALYDSYDAVGLLDLPANGPPVDPAMIRAALGELFAREQEPRPAWIADEESWPPPAEDPRTFVLE